MIDLQSSLIVIGFDPYFISYSGEILATWDHHVFSDGFNVKFASIPPSNCFITGLNELGAEFDVSPPMPNPPLNSDPIAAR